jgi:GAF domain-containing protein
MASLPSAPSTLPETSDETIRRLTAELREAREQQAAATDILELINRSPRDLAPVFDAMLEKAHRLCGVDYGTLQLYDRGRFCAVATRGYPEPIRDLVSRPYALGPNNPIQSLIDGGPLLAISDLVKHHEEPVNPRTQAAIEIGIRSILFLPLRKDNLLLGLISAGRKEVGHFSEKEIALLQNFAAQAVIAMENARLITETREALEQQTATAEVLQVINASPGDLGPVFDAMLDKAMSLCEAASGVLMTYDGEYLHAVSWRGVPEVFYDYLRKPVRPAPGNTVFRLLQGEEVVHIADLREDADNRYGDAARRAIIDLGGARTLVLVPLRKDGKLVGTIRVYRQEVRPFTDKQIALLKNFAAQAVIAMENARLLTETREALEQQTATAEVLGVINNSPGDLGPVFDAILEKAHSLCGAAHGALVVRDGNQFLAVATHGLPEQFAKILRQPFPSYPGAPYERLLQGERLIHIRDQAAGKQTYPIGRASVEAGGRTLLFVPLRKDDSLLGYITAGRQEVRPFSDNEIALLENFAAQAVIAMENARLLTETREALEQQTATAEVLQVINSSPGDLAPVFDAILEKAHALCGATRGALVTNDDEWFHAVATRGMPERFAEHMRHGFPFMPGHLGEQLLRGEHVHILDLPAAAVDSPPELARLQLQAVELAGTRTILMVPLCKDDRLIGYIAGYRTEVRPFTDKQIALLQNFAAQAVIAMENARLIMETREALEQQTATAEILQVINSSPGNLTPVFEAMLEKAHTLCGADNGGLLTYDGERFWPVAWHGMSTQLADARSAGIDPNAAPSFGRIVRGNTSITSTTWWSSPRKSRTMRLGGGSAPWSGPRASELS